MACKGSWKNSARNIKYNGDTVECELKAQNGNWITNKLKFSSHYNYHNFNGKFYADDEYNNIRGKFNNNNMNWAILLTSCIRKNNNLNDDKLFYYERSIKTWLEKTNLPIFIVESSGYSFPEFKNTRLNVCTFDLQNQNSSSQYEAKSILFAMETFKEDLKKYTHILKVTARYYVDCESILSTLPDVDIVVQSTVDHNIKFNNSELFGFRNGLEYQIFNPILNKGLMEHNIYNSLQSNTYARLPPFENIYKTKRGGDSLIVNPL
jgi:hypothetical protein